MDSSDFASKATVVASEHNSPLMRLATEIREMIYQHLLVTKYTTWDYNDMNTKDVSLTNLQY